MMYGDWIVLCITLFYSQLTWCLNNLDSSHNIICQPLPQVVAVNGNGLPYFVELHQCQGQVENSNPRVKNCTFDKFENVKVKITHHGQTSGDKYVTLKNHTSCKEQCSSKCPNFLVHNKRCHCDICPYPVAPVGHECPDDFKWDTKTCKCKCSLKGDNPPRRKKFNETQCKYVCLHPRPCGGGRTFNPNTCSCIHTGAVARSQEPGNSQQWKLIAALVIGELVVLCLIFDIYLYWKHKKGLICNTVCKIRRSSNNNNNHGNRNNSNQNDGGERLQPNGNGMETEKIMRVDQNGCSHLEHNSTA